ncbi:uncharacterized protein L199_006802 [Kwoniella botswanensis]|uniref:uncharacterized protein n=1 Tax=Kwoniella botswanensis TaxID=1268659 RepID=UPI00315CDC23
MFSLPSSITFTSLSSLLVTKVALARDSIKVKINLPPTGEYRDWENSADYKGGGDSKVHTFNIQQIQDDFAIKHGNKRWDMTRYVKATDTTDKLIPEFTLADVLKKPIEVKFGGPARLWCPADQGTCTKKNCQVPNIDSTAA